MVKKKKYKFNIGDRVKFVGSGRHHYDFGGKVGGSVKGAVYQISARGWYATEPTYNVKGGEREESADFLYMETEFELIPSFDEIEYSEPEEDEFTDKCVSQCKPGNHACEK